MIRMRLHPLTLSVLLCAQLLAAAESQPPTNRTLSLKAICQRLDVGPGAVIADVGCGKGPDTLVFATIVGTQGTVLAEEIDVANLNKVVEVTDQKGFHQVVPVLGESGDPRLPDGSVDMIYMNRVFHHFSHPQAMLERMWFDLKPGGFLVIVDQKKGPQTDWTPTAKREKEHHWTSETTVVRLAREAGFGFQGVLDDLWHEKDPFVLAFRKPLKATKPNGDPDLPRAMDVKAVVRALPIPQPEAGSAVVFFGLDRGRAVLPALKQKLPTSCRLFDVVIDEWALSREDLPPGGQIVGTEVVRTEKGHVALPAEARVGLVVFADAYHRLWEPLPLLEGLKQNLAEGAKIVVIERKGPDTESRRLAGHRRRLSSKQAIEDMRTAGFQLRRTLRSPARDRYFLLFEPATLLGPGAAQNQRTSRF